MDSIQKDFMSPMAGMLPVTAPTPSESKTRSPGFFDTLIAELDKGKQQLKHSTDDRTPNSPVNRESLPPAKGSHHLESEFQDPSEGSSKRYKAPELGSEGEPRHPETNSGRQTESEGKIENQQDVSTESKDDSVISSSAPDSQTDQNAANTWNQSKELQEVDFGYHHEQVRPNLVESSMEGISSEEDPFFKDLNEAQEVLMVSDEEFLLVTQSPEEKSSASDESVLKLPEYDEQSIEEEAQAFVEFILDQAETPTKEFHHQELEPSKAFSALPALDEAAELQGLNQDADEVDSELLWRGLLEIMQDPQSLKEDQIQEELQGLIHALQEETSGLSKSLSNGLSNPERLREFLQRLESLLKQPGSDKIELLMSGVDEELRHDLKRSFMKVLNNEGKISLGENFEAVSAKLAEKRELKKLGYEFLVEKNTKESVEEKPLQNPGRQLELGLNSKISQGLAATNLREMPANQTIERQIQPEMSTVNRVAEGEVLAKEEGGDFNDSQKRETRQGLVRIPDLKADSDEKASSLKFNFNLSRETNLEGELKKDPASSLENRLAALSRLEASRDGFRFKTAGERLERSVMNQVILKVRALRPPKVNVLRISLNPDNLGNVKVELKTAKEGLKIHFQAETQAVKDIIDRNLGQLRDTFKAQGIDVGKLEVEVRDQGHHESGRGKESQGKQNKNRKNKNESMTTPESEDISEVVGENRINEYA